MKVRARAVRMTVADIVITAPDYADTEEWLNDNIDDVIEEHEDDIYNGHWEITNWYQLEEEEDGSSLN